MQNPEYFKDLGDGRQSRYVTINGSDPAVVIPVTISGASSTGGALGVDIQQTEIMQPVETQSHLTQIIQTHNAVSIASAANSIPSTWQSADGFIKLNVGVTTTGKTSLQVYWSYDGTTIHTKEPLIYNGEPKTTDVSAPYFKLVPNNDDTVTETVTVYAYLVA